ncbi:MAG: hypothetical protein R3F29_10825 [Planctomycetota bacterium]
MAEFEDRSDVPAGRDVVAIDSTPELESIDSVIGEGGGRNRRRRPRRRD